MDAATEAGLAAAEERRRSAMLAADTAQLRDMLSAALVYVHSSGARDTRASYLDKLDRGLLRYEQLAFTDPHYRLLGQVGLVHADMHATVLRNGERHAVRSTTLSVWLHDQGRWELQAVQAAPGQAR